MVFSIMLIFLKIPRLNFTVFFSRFAQFFIKPLMSADATTREIKAVDSGLYPWFLAYLLICYPCMFIVISLSHIIFTHTEHQKNLLSDPWRMNQVYDFTFLLSWRIPIPFANYIKAKRKWFKRDNSLRRCFLCDNDETTKVSGGMEVLLHH